MDTTSSAVFESSRILVVVNKRLPGITIYDAALHTQTAQVKTAVAPHEVALSADGRLAYVPIYGSSGVGKPGTDEHMLHCFRTEDGREAGALDTGNFKRLHSIVVGKSGRVYISAECAGSVIVVDAAVKGVLADIPTGSFTSHFIAINKEETKLYCSNVQSETVSVLDLMNKKLAETIATGHQNQRMTLSPDDGCFVTNLGPVQQVAFYRTADNKLHFAVTVDGIPFVGKFSGDGRFFFNAGMRGSEIGVWKIDVGARRVVGTASIIGQDLGSLEVNPFDGTVYVSDQPTSQISVLDPESMTIIKTIATAPAPDAIAFGTVS